MMASPTPKTTLLNISTVASRYGVSLRTLRFYENQGLLSQVRHGPMRLYTGRDCVRLEIILRGKKLGLSLREIDALIRERKPGFDEISITELMTERQLKCQLESLCRKRAEIETAMEKLQIVLKKRSP